MANITGYQSALQTADVTIAINTTTSDLLALGGTVATGLILTGAITGTELSFTASFDGITFYTLKDEAGNAITLPITGSSGYYNLNEEQFVHCSFIKVVSNASEAAARTITIIARPF